MSSRTVALLFGGRSGEHEVSLRSAASVASGLSARHEVLPVLIDKQGRWFLQQGPEPKAEGGTAVFLVPSPEDHGRLRRLADATPAVAPDTYFPVLHGTYGEDGTVQGLLELASVPYVGAGVAASAAGMDKELMKALFAQAGVEQVRYRVLRSRDAKTEAELLESLGLPVFVKPANLGSSVGISTVKSAETLPAAIDEALAFDRKVIVEAGVPDAREIECAVLGNDEPRASVAGEIFPGREFYDYEAKYLDDSSRTEIPANVTPQQMAEVQRLAIAAFKAIDACGMSRVDFLLSRSTGDLVLNEINTIPGFTTISMFAKLWEASGLTYPALVDRLIELAVERHREKQGLRTSAL
jgi:D-alanine-D-alanine ligase